MLIPDEIDKCHNDINIPCSFIDKSGHNQTGFYTQFDLIQLHPKKLLEIKKEAPQKQQKKSAQIQFSKFLVFHLVLKR